MFSDGNVLGIQFFLPDSQKAIGERRFFTMRLIGPFDHVSFVEAQFYYHG